MYIQIFAGRKKELDDGWCSAMAQPTHRLQHLQISTSSLTYWKKDIFDGSMYLSANQIQKYTTFALWYVDTNNRRILPGFGQRICVLFYSSVTHLAIFTSGKMKKPSMCISNFVFPIKARNWEHSLHRIRRHGEISWRLTRDFECYNYHLKISQF